MSAITRKANTSGELATLAGDLTTPQALSEVRAVRTATPVLATPTVHALVWVAVTVLSSSSDGGTQPQ